MNSILFDQLETTIKRLSWEQRFEALRSAYSICMDTNDLDGAARVLGLFTHSLVDESVITLSNNYLRRRITDGWSVIACFDSSRQPREKEILIYYGNYPHSVECLPATQRVYRHPIYFNMIEHASVEYHPAWEPLERIYILTTESRVDRYYHILLELCRVSAPLHRIRKYCGGFTAFTGNKTQDKYICASQNHADVAADFIERGDSACLILEDDFSFLSDVAFIHYSLSTLFGRRDLTSASSPYNTFYVCFLSYSKWGLIEDCDDLISYNKQSCTTSSGYILQKSTAAIIRDCQVEGVDAMKRGESPGIYCCDRYWCKYGGENKMLSFKRKLGFQYVTHSDIVNRANIHFD